MEVRRRRDARSCPRAVVAAADPERAPPNPEGDHCDVWFSLRRWCLARAACLVHAHGADARGPDEAAFASLEAFAHAALDRFDDAPDDTVARVLGGGVATRWNGRLAATEPKLAAALAEPAGPAARFLAYTRGGAGMGTGRGDAAGRRDRDSPRRRPEPRRAETGERRREIIRRYAGASSEEVRDAVSSLVAATVTACEADGCTPSADECEIAECSEDETETELTTKVVTSR